MMAAQVLVLAVATVFTASTASAKAQNYNTLPIITDGAQIVRTDPNLSFNYRYEVNAAETGDQKTHEETLDNGVVVGSYSVLQPDNTLRIVKYRADDESGFKAEVQYQDLQSGSSSFSGSSLGFSTSNFGSSSVSNLGSSGARFDSSSRTNIFRF
ncbi:cuticle protein 7-like [Homarus americanus]|uniref:cuticle protein 7-like n=1 Tax=Homarus americanus TaxID=6706 RepID=UPI001C45CAA6|nr:cuticle protein 7-like [Homarus americanus]